MSRTISAALGICALCWLTTPALAASLATGLEGYWQFDGDGADSSGHGRDLSMPAGLSFETGLLGQAVLVPSPTPSSAQDEERVPVRPVDDAVFDFGSDNFTVQIWARFTTLYGTQILIEKLANNPGRGWMLEKMHLAQGVRFVAWGTEGGGFTATSGNLAIGTTSFHQFVARRRGDQVYVFFDGSEVGAGGTAGYAIPDNNLPLLIGARSGGQFQPVEGLVDEVAIWSRALSDAEINALYNGGSGMMVPEPAVLALVSLGLLGLGAARRL